MIKLEVTILSSHVARPSQSSISIETNSSNVKEILRTKPLRQLEKIPSEVLLEWIQDTLDKDYPRDHKILMVKISGQSWKILRSAILNTAKSESYEKVRKLNNILRTDLGKRRIEGINTFAMVGEGSAGVNAFVLVNQNIRDLKIELYVLYRNLAGRPRLNLGFFGGKF